MTGQTRREFLKRTALSVASVGTTSVISSCRVVNRKVIPSTNKPNVVLIMTDDQGWGDIHSHGNDIVETPVLDKLAAEGARFDRFFVSPVCAPTRASLLTGRYHLRTGTHGVTHGRENMRSEEVTIAEVLKQAGYVTGCFGKWHNGAHYPYHPNGQGFDEFFGFCAGHWNNYFDTTLERNGEDVKTEGYITDVLTDEVIRFIKNNKDKPFFCYVPYNAPHAPFQVPNSYFDKYKLRGLDDKLACVYGMCENIDFNVGRILERMEHLNTAENTIVMFLTDNGPNSDRYNGDMKGRKGSVHEGGVRVPLFVRWPGQIKAGTKLGQITAHIDIFATIVELCGVAMPRQMLLDGVSLAPLLKGQEKDWPDRMLFTFRTPAGQIQKVRGSVRTQRWRVVKTAKRWELYDMKEDPGQKCDVAKEHPHVTHKLAGAFEAAVKEVTKEDLKPLPIPIGYPQRSVVVLPGHEANLEPPTNKGISYKGRAGWANDWITSWTSTDAYCWWDIDVISEGQYEVTLMHTFAEENLGAKMRAEVNGQALERVAGEVHDPKPIPSPDRVPRRAVYETKWASLALGTFKLKKGRTKLCVRAVDIPGDQAIDLKAVRLRRN